MDTNTGLLTPRQAAERLGRSPIGIVRMCANGQLPAFKWNGRWFIHAARMEQLIETMLAPRWQPEAPPERERSEVKDWARGRTSNGRGYTSEARR